MSTGHSIIIASLIEISPAAAHGVWVVVLVDVLLVLHPVEAVVPRSHLGRHSIPPPSPLVRESPPLSLRFDTSHH